MIYANNSFYEGEWVNNKPNGKGSFIDSKGKKSEGEFKNGLFLEPANLSSVKIGNLVWTNKNLNVDKFQNGDIIPQAKSYKEWHEANLDQKPCWCYYKFDSSNGPKYGKLYNWCAVNDKRGIAPFGWRIASHNDYKNLQSNCKNYFFYECKFN